MHIRVLAPTSKSPGMQMLQGQKQEHEQRLKSQRGPESKLGGPRLTGSGSRLEDK